MRLDDFLKSLGSSGPDGEGSFTIAADRARKLLSERALTDPWQAWLALFQGLHKAGAGRIAVGIDRQQVRIQVDGIRYELAELVREDRFLLGWLNLDWFGEPTWNPELSSLSLKWRGSIWKRYSDSASLRTLIRAALPYSPVPIELDNSVINQRGLPRARHYQLYCSGPDSGLSFENELEGLEQERCRLTQLSDSTHLAAVAFTSGKSWSQARWIHHGVLIREERNTLERPGLFLIASVEALGLNTDLSGFQVIHDERYLEFANRLKKEVLWML